MKTVKIIPSKSDAHRAYICAALSQICNARGILMDEVHLHESSMSSGNSINDNSIDSDSSINDEELFGCNIVCNESSEDIEATKTCLKAIVDSQKFDNQLSRVGVDLYCGESGSTLRFLLPIVGALNMRGIFHPVGSLSKRPLSPLYEELCSHGMTISKPGSLPLIAEGQLKSGKYVIPGNISSQFVSGLLFALPLLEGDSEILIEDVLQSSPYVDMTLRTLKTFGIAIHEIDYSESKSENVTNKSHEKHNGNSSITRAYMIGGNQKYVSPKEYVVEGDWSNGAFWFAMGALGRESVRVEGLDLNSHQGDKRILDVLNAFGADYSIINEDSTNWAIEVRPSKGRMKGITIDAGETPDMVPVISLIAAFAKGITRIENAGRLRIKESDRIHTVVTALHSLGVQIDELPEGLIIHGGTSIKPSTVESYNDHRLAMMLAAASVAIKDNETIKLIGWQAASKSYPAFFDIMKNLGLDNKLELL